MVFVITEIEGVRFSTVYELCKAKDCDLGHGVWRGHRYRPRRDLRGGKRRYFALDLSSDAIIIWKTARHYSSYAWLDEACSAV